MFRQIAATLFVVLLPAQLLHAEPPQADGARAAVKELQAFLQKPRDQRGAIAEQPFASTPLTATAAKQAAALLQADYQAGIRAARQREVAAGAMKINGKTMRVFHSIAGKKPAGGRSLYISMHGGGGAPARVNDSQWRNQQRLYRIAEGVYVAPRAPSDTWNLWHQAHIDGFFDRLIENMMLVHQVNPDRVYLLGYSAGGDGVYQLAPRMADRFAAAAMMAGHPNDASPRSLRNLPLTIHCGARDAAYKRNQVAAEWGKKLDALQQEDPQGYTHHVQIHAGKGHWMDRQDAVALPWMAKFTRNPLPARIVWRQDDVTHPRFYWLEVPAQEAKKGVEITATRKGQAFTVSSSNAKTVTVLLNDDIATLDKPVTIKTGAAADGGSDGRTLFSGVVKRTIATMHKSIQTRSTAPVYSAAVEVNLN